VPGAQALHHWWMESPHSAAGPELVS
jgi:hypothetical protein